MKKGQSSIRKKEIPKETLVKVKKIYEDFMKKPLADMEHYFDDTNLNDIEVSDEDFKRDLDAFVPKPIVRTYAELKKEAEEKINIAMKDIKFGFIERDDFFLDSNADLQRFVGAVDKERVKKALFEFAYICGNYNNNKKWIRIESGLYFCLPDLLEKGNHAALVTFFADKISGKLAKNFDNAITTVLKKKGFEILKKENCFSKGHLLAREHERLDILNDIRTVFKEMQKPVNDRDFSAIKVIARKLK